MKRKKKAPRARKASRSTAKPLKARAKRAQKTLVKLKRPVKNKSRRVKLVKRKLTATEELKINALIARVYQKAAEEMRRVEEANAAAKSHLFAEAAKEVVRLEATAERFKA